MVSTSLPVCVPRQAEAPVDGGVKQSSDGKRIGRGQWGSLWVLFFLFLYFVSRVKSFERCKVYEWSRLSGSRYGIECVLEACRMVVTPIKCNQDWTSVTGRSANVISCHVVVGSGFTKDYQIFCAASAAAGSWLLSHITPPQRQLMRGVPLRPRKRSLLTGERIAGWEE